MGCSTVPITVDILIECLPVRLCVDVRCSSLPELLEKKRLIDLHTNVATAVLDHIKVSGLRPDQARSEASSLAVGVQYSSLWSAAAMPPLR